MITLDSDHPFVIGASGQVFFGKLNGITPVAVKKITLPYEASREMKMIEREIQTLTRLVNERILQCYGFIINRDEVVIVTQRMAGSIRDALVGNLTAVFPGLFRFIDRLSVAADAAEGLAWLHSQPSPTVHGDIKPENILIGQRGEAKVCDFGSVRIASSARFSSSFTQSMGTLVPLTERYMAPELFVTQLSTLASDVYALGVTLFELFADRHPFVDLTDDSLDAAVIHSTMRAPPPVPVDLLEPNGVPPAVVELVGKCLDTNPRARPSAKECALMLRAAYLEMKDA